MPEEIDIADSAYDEAIDNIMTGDIHLVPDTFLFVQIQEWMDKGKREMLSDISVVELHERWNTNLFI